MKYKHYEHFAYTRLADHFGSLTMTVAARRLKMEVLSTVLWLQGRELVGQPYVKQEGDKGHILCWNGDVFGGLLGEIERKF